MARAKQRKAAKDYPQHGIKKGDTYWFAQIKTGPRSSRTIRQLAPIKRQQLTTSEYQIALYDFEDAQQALGEMDGAQDLADTIRQLGEEQQEKLDGMPEGLQSGSTGEMLQERADACAQAADEIEEVISDWESSQTDDDGEPEDGPDEDEYVQRVKDVSVG